MITIDSTTYDVNIKVIDRNAEFLYKYAERLENGELAAEMLGVYYNFTVHCGMSSKNVEQYAALYLRLTEPNVFHEITMPAPSGYETFTGYFANVRDRAVRWADDGEAYFRDLSFTVISKSPARMPG